MPTTFQARIRRQQAIVEEFRRSAGGDPARVPAGRVFGLGPIAGPFTYRPKTYAELSRSQRAALLREPRFRRFVAQFASGRGVAPAARWTIAPEEMLSRRPCLLTLPPP